MAVLLCKAVIRLSNEPQAHIDPKRTLNNKKPLRRVVSDAKYVNL
jgi:hypothetical protein